MAAEHDPGTAIGTVTHYFSGLSVAAVTLTAPLAVGERIHIKGHTTDVEQNVESLQVDHAAVTSAAPGDDVALKVDGHVRDHDLLFREG
ncbi:MAG: translation elongation factor-like protein [Chloroflexota bacterium]